MRISDWSSDVCSSDLRLVEARVYARALRLHLVLRDRPEAETELGMLDPVGAPDGRRDQDEEGVVVGDLRPSGIEHGRRPRDAVRSAADVPVVETDERDHQKPDRRDDEGRTAKGTRDDNGRGA